MRDLAHGLAHCHACGVVHRDLTVDNILVRDNGDAGFSALINDFGVGGLLQDAKSGARGSMRHYAPEAINKDAPAESIPACGGFIN